MVMYRSGLKIKLKKQFRKPGELLLMTSFKMTGRSGFLEANYKEIRGESRLLHSSCSYSVKLLLNHCPLVSSIYILQWLYHSPPFRVLGVKCGSQRQANMHSLSITDTWVMTDGIIFYIKRVSWRQHSPCRSHFLASVSRLLTHIITPTDYQRSGQREMLFQSVSGCEQVAPGSTVSCIPVHLCVCMSGAVDLL